GLEHDARAALPFLQPIRAGADRACADIAPGRLDDLARHRADEADEVANVREVRVRERDAQRVAVERAQALDRRVEVELARGLRLLDYRPRAEDEIGEDRLAGAPAVGGEPALVRVDVILGGELARLAAEDRVVVEQDPAL